MGIKATVAMYKAVLAAGFKLSKVQQMDGRDGIFWKSTLVHGKTKILEAGNGGYGGADEVDFLLDRGSVKPFIDQLYSIPEVDAFIREQMVELLNIEKKFRDDDSRDFEAEIAAVETAPLARDDETIASIVGSLSDTYGTVSRLKRSMKTKLCWVEKTEDGDSDNIVSVKAQDTPSNRAAVMKRYGDSVDVFVGDLIQGL